MGEAQYDPLVLPPNTFIFFPPVPPHIQDSIGTLVTPARCDPLWFSRKDYSFAHVA
jgi:hypothetical protein